MSMADPNDPVKGLVTTSDLKARRKLRLPHIHWWRYDGWDFMRGGIYHCRCGRTEYGASR